MNKTNTEHEVYGLILRTIDSMSRFSSRFKNRQLESAIQSTTVGYLDNYSRLGGQL